MSADNAVSLSGRSSHSHPMSPRRSTPMCVTHQPTVSKIAVTPPNGTLPATHPPAVAQQPPAYPPARSTRTAIDAAVMTTARAISHAEISPMARRMGAT